MLIISLKGLLAAGAVVLLNACSTPGADPGRLCAPIQANTSAQEHPRAADLAVPAALPTPLPASLPTKAAIRLALVLPLRSESLGPPADALRAGFMAAYERDRDGISVTLIESGDSADATLAAYKDALREHDMVVGPLARSAVTAVAASGAVSKPTIALNYPELRAGSELAIPNQMLVMGLSIEEEARQVALWAGAEHPHAAALVVSGPNAWQRRLAAAFSAQWKQLGYPLQTAELTASNGYLSEAGINALKLRVDAEQPALLFAALDPDQLRQVRGILGTELPAYGTSSVNPGTEPGAALAELDNMRVLDMPWQVQPDHPAVMIYPRWSGNRRTPDMDRLYALGIDAFRVAREIALNRSSAFQMDGVTGRLSVNFGQGAARFERIQPTAVYAGGAYKLVGKKR